jgi:hypothetical protein
MPTQLELDQAKQLQQKNAILAKMSAKQRKAMAMQRRNYSIIPINGNNLLVKGITVEVPIPAQPTPAATYTFPDFQILRDTSLWGIKAYTTTTLPKSPTNTGVITDGILAATYMTLQDYDSYNFLQNSPLLDYCPTIPGLSVSDGGQFQRDGFVGQRVNYPNCVMFVVDTSQINADTAYSFTLKIYYSFFPNVKMDRLGGTFGSRR